MPYGFRSKLGTPIIRWLKLNIVGPQSTAMAPDHPRHYPPQQPGSCRKAPQTGENSDASWAFFWDFIGGFHGGNQASLSGELDSKPWICAVVTPK
jgi:hypothetical protein